MNYLPPVRRGVYQRFHNSMTAVEISAHPWGFECTRPDCHFSVCAISEEHAHLIESTHPCPYAGGTTTYGWSIVATLLEEVWKKVDDDMLSLMQPEANTDYAALKARLRAFAEVLAIFMKPHFTTADEIAREARRRYDHRNDPEYCTAGLAQRRLEPPPDSASKYEPPSLQNAYSAVEKAKSKLTEKQITSIKAFADNGFPLDAIAKAQGVTVEVVKTVVKG